MVPDFSGFDIIFGLLIGGIVGFVLALLLWSLVGLGWWSFAIIGGCAVVGAIALPGLTR